MHAIEKILAKNSGRAEVHTGEIVTAKVDFAEINDLYLQTVYSFYEMGGEKVWTCGYDFCWCETVAPDFSRARGHFPDTIVAAWAAARSANQSDVNLGIKERML